MSFCYSQSENNPSEHLKTGQQGTKGFLNNSTVGWQGVLTMGGNENLCFAKSYMMFFV